MRTAYTFSVLRYIHDIVSGEFVNVGVALYSQDFQFLGAACLKTYSRLSSFFGEIEGEHFKRMMQHISSGIEELAERLQTELPLGKRPTDVRGWVDQVWPPDDSSLQFSPMRGGITEDPKATLEELYERFVERYSHRAQPSSRTDEDILKIFRIEFAQRYILGHLRPKKILTMNYEHEFPLAWKNHVWHVSEALSFDLTTSGNILEKANQWLGRALTLAESSERFTLHLLLGKPQQDKLKSSFTKAENILHKMPCSHEFIREDEAADFAARIEDELKRHREDR